MSVVCGAKEAAGKTVPRLGENQERGEIQLQGYNHAGGRHPELVLVRGSSDGTWSSGCVADITAPCCRC